LRELDPYAVSQVLITCCALYGFLAAGILRRLGRRGAGAPRELWVLAVAGWLILAGLWAYVRIAGHTL
jgi:hypothetical protein